MQGGSPASSRPKQIPQQQDHQRGRSDTERWTRGEECREEEGGEDVKRGSRASSFDWREDGQAAVRAPKWVPDERETWKTKER